MNHQYDDIINHPHHVSRNHPPMSMHDRAAQFSPFAALVGYEDAVRETSRLTEPRRELDEQELAELNRRLVFLESRLPEHPDASIRYFVPDGRKSGGRCVTVSGKVLAISAAGRGIVMADGEKINIPDVLAIEIPGFE